MDLSGESSCVATPRSGKALEEAELINWSASLRGLREHLHCLEIFACLLVAAAAARHRPSARGSQVVAAAAAAGSQPCGVPREPERKTGSGKASLGKAPGWEMQAELPGPERRTGGREAAWKVSHCPARREAGLDLRLLLDLTRWGSVGVGERRQTAAAEQSCSEAGWTGWWRQRW